MLQAPPLGSEQEHQPKIIWRNSDAKVTQFLSPLSVADSKGRGGGAPHPTGVSNFSASQVYFIICICNTPK